MQDQRDIDGMRQSPVRGGIGLLGGIVGAILIGGMMWFAYTSVLPNLPVIGPVLETMLKPPLVDAGPGIDLGSRSNDTPAWQSEGSVSQSESLLIPGGTPQEMDIKDEATHARFIRETELLFGRSITSLGTTEDQYIADSYGWCATIQQYGPAEANRLQAQNMRSMYSAAQIEAMMPIVRAGNELIETYLCS